MINIKIIIKQLIKQSLITLRFIKKSHQKCSFFVLLNRFIEYSSDKILSFILFLLKMSRYQGLFRGEQPSLQQKNHDKPRRHFSVQMPKTFNGGTWDATHMTNFLASSNYSNWKGDKKNISRISQDSPRRSQSNKSQHFFRTTKDNKNASKIGYTPIFPLVSNAPVDDRKAIILNDFLQSSRLASNQERLVSGRKMKLRCSPQQKFHFQGNAVKFQLTDPLTMHYEELNQNLTTGFQKQRMVRLISKRHPHGITGIDHPENPESQFYSTYHQSIRIRQEPNSRQTFLIDRDWKEKKRSVPPVDEWKSRKVISIRKFRNDNVHGYNILTNRKLQA